MTQTELLKKIREDFKKIADQAQESAETDDIDQAWADADFIIGIANSIMDSVEEEQEREE